MNRQQPPVGGGRRVRRIWLLSAALATLIVVLAGVYVWNLSRPTVSKPTGIGKPTPNTSQGSTTISGIWVLQQATSTSQVDSQLVETALGTPHIRGYSLRVPWSAIDGSSILLDQGLEVARTHHVAFSIRFMAGRYTPAEVFQGGSPSYTVAGTRFPLPFNSDGSPNTTFENAYRQEVSTLAGWSRKHGVRLLHLPWYGELWNEYYLGPAVMGSPGYSYQAWLTAHERLAQIAFQFAGSDLGIEFPLSGVDNSPNHSVFKDLSNYANSLAGSHPTWLYVQTNGLGQATYGMRVFGGGLKVEHAQQMFRGDDYDWAAIFNLVRLSHDAYVEIYAASFRPSLLHHAELVAQVGSFVALSS
jgi:hypothetical protein